MSNLDSDTLDKTALAAMVFIADQTATGDLTGPEARERLLHAARLADETRRQSYAEQARQLTAAMQAGEIDLATWQIRLARAAREELARTGQREVTS